jgi:hypothetical protein
MEHGQAKGHGIDRVMYWSISQYHGHFIKVLDWGKALYPFFYFLSMLIFNSMM